eukprot:6547944-Pyramimonas_sp.AAC.1
MTCLGYWQAFQSAPPDQAFRSSFAVSLSWSPSTARARSGPTASEHSGRGPRRPSRGNQHEPRLDQ